MRDGMFIIDECGCDARTAFEDAVERAENLYGLGGGTGSIAEKDAFTIVREEPMSPTDAEALATSMLNSGDPRVTDTWAPACAIPLLANSKHTGWLFFGTASLF